jgi:hypothetical protein
VPEISRFVSTVYSRIYIAGTLLTLADDKQTKLRPSISAISATLPVSMIYKAANRGYQRFNEPSNRELWDEPSVHQLHSRERSLRFRGRNIGSIRTFPRSIQIESVSANDNSRWVTVFVLTSASLPRPRVFSAQGLQRGRTSRPRRLAILVDSKLQRSKTCHEAFYVP